MENYVYEVEYPFPPKPQGFTAKELQMFRELFLLSAKLRIPTTRPPHVVIPCAAQIFEETVEKCEQIVKEFNGKLKAVIDYTRYYAKIDMWCCYVEFAEGEFLETLQEISLYAMSVLFMPLTTGWLKIHIEMPYFMPVPDGESF